MFIIRKLLLILSIFDDSGKREREELFNKTKIKKNRIVFLKY